MKIKNANKWKYKPQRMGRGEEAGVERNFSTAVNRGENPITGKHFISFFVLNLGPTPYLSIVFKIGTVLLKMHVE